MGWLFKTHPTSLKSEIAELTKVWEYDVEGNHVKVNCLAHCWRGGRFSGNLWVVFEKVYTDALLAEVKRERFIALFLMKYMGGWGYKDLTEDMGPVELSCPIKYLDMVPDPGGYATKWREEVRKLHNDSVARRRRLKVGVRVKLVDELHIGDMQIGGSEVVIRNVNPLTAYLEGFGQMTLRPHFIASFL